MLISQSFDSDFSFAGASPDGSLSEGMDNEGGSSVGEEGVDDDQWGFVSNDEYDMVDNHDVSTDGSGYAGSGLLILDSVETNSGGGVNNDSSRLSIPGTDSLPSEIDSLSDVHLNGEVEQPNHNEHQNSIAFRKRSLILSGLSAAGLIISCLGYVAWDRNALSSANIKLHQELETLKHENELNLQAEIERSLALEVLVEEKDLEIDILEQEKEAIKELYSSSKPSWEDEDTPKDGEFYLIDNCWLKAKASVQFGPCGDDTKSTINDFKTKAWRDLKEMWNGTTTTDKAAYLAAATGMAHMLSMNDDDDDSSKWSFPGYNVMGGKKKNFSSEPMSDGSAKFDFEEAKATLAQASGAVSEAVLSLTGAMASGIKDLSADPVAHLAGALKGASQASKNGPPISMNGVFDASKAFSSASAAMGKVMKETNEILSVKVSEMIDDPLSFFEFETEMK